MIKIWAKTILGEKITRDFIFEKNAKFQKKDFDVYLREICEHMNIPTPVILKSHRHNFERFNITKFRPLDFVESIDFDSFVLENIPEN